MKKVLFIAVVVLLGLGNVNAQEVKFGAKVGLNSSNFTGDLEDSDAKIGFNLGKKEVVLKPFTPGIVKTAASFWRIKKCQTAINGTKISSQRNSGL